MSLTSNTSYSWHKNPRRRGAAAILIIIMFASLMLLAFLGINVSLLQRHHAEAQIATDLAARRGVDLLAQGDLEESEIEDLVRAAATANWPTFLRDDGNIGSADVDIDFGSARVNRGKYSFAENEDPKNSVRVGLARDVTTVGPLARIRPQVSIGRDATAAALERDICLVIDRSGSMTFDLTSGDWMNDRGTHPYNPMSTSGDASIRKRSHTWWLYWAHPTNSRWSSMLPAVYQLASELEDTNQNEQFSIVTYSSNDDFNMYDHGLVYKLWDIHAAETIFPPTYDYMTAVTTMDNYYRDAMPVAGATDISAGIDQAVTVLTGPDARPHAFKVMIVMTDGAFNRGREPWLAAADAAAEGIEVHTVTFSDQANQVDMVTTAAAGRGLHFHAPDGDKLEDIFTEIAHLPAAAIIE